LITTQNRIEKYFDKDTAGVNEEVKSRSFSFINARKNAFNFNYSDSSNIVETPENSLFREHSNNRIAKYFYSNQPKKSVRNKRYLRKILNGFDKKNIFGKKQSEKNNSLNIKLILSVKLAQGFIYDGLGSVRNLTAENGQVTDAYTYYAFGEILNKTGNTENRFLFTGEQYDPNIGFYYLRSRLYNPSNGRFLTFDSFEGDPYSPAFLNKYNYCLNNPGNNIDPLGKCSLTFYAIGTTLVLAEIVFFAFTRSIFKNKKDTGRTNTFSYSINMILSLGAGLAGGIIQFSIDETGLDPVDKPLRGQYAFVGFGVGAGSNISLPSASSIAFHSTLTTEYKTDLKDFAGWGGAAFFSGSAISYGIGFGALLLGDNSFLDLSGLGAGAVSPKKPFFYFPNLDKFKNLLSAGAALLVGVTQLIEASPY